MLASGSREGAYLDVLYPMSGKQPPGYHMIQDLGLVPSDREKQLHIDHWIAFWIGFGLGSCFEESEGETITFPMLLHNC